MEKGSSSSSAGANGGPDSLNGLSLGLRPNTGGGLPAKKGRAGLMQRCQVEGCKVDLSDAKAYYSRHRVCGVHSKSPMVIVAGIEQRFCQQCSRFHQLTEFDQGKRSCRRRLAGHNERRRKPPQGCKNLRPSISDNNHISERGGFVMDLSSYPSFLTRTELFPDSASERGLTTNRAAITGKYEFPWHSNSPENPLSDLLTFRPSYSASPVASSQECFNGVSNSSNALSLLSNNPWAGPKSRLGVNGQPSYDNPGSAIGVFVCSPWNFKGNGDVGLGQQNVVQFGELDQTREFDSPPVAQHMHRSL